MGFLLLLNNPNLVFLLLLRVRVKSDEVVLVCVMVHGPLISNAFSTNSTTTTTIR